MQWLVTTQLHSIADCQLMMVSEEKKINTCAVIYVPIPLHQMTPTTYDLFSQKKKKIAYFFTDIEVILV